MNPIGSRSVSTPVSGATRARETTRPSAPAAAEPRDGFQANAATRKDRIAKATVISGIGVFAAGLATLGFAATASLAASPVLMLVGCVASAAGLVTTLTGATYGDDGFASSDLSRSLGDPANPLSPLNPSNPANPVNMMMHQ